MPGIAHIPYLEKRPSGFFFRRRFPPIKPESNFIHEPTLCLSLRTKIPEDANPSRGFYNHRGDH